MFIWFFHLQAALDYLWSRPGLDPTRIVVFGRSLGGAVGSALAKNNPDKVQKCSS
jgi:dienelactone hydrolase